MRTLGSGLSTAVSRTITEPRWFLEIGFSAPLRLTSDVSQTWNGVNWAEAQIAVSGVAWDGSISQNVSIEIFDRDNTIAQLSLNEKLTNRSVRLWLFQRGDTSAGNVLALPELRGNDYKGKPFYVTISAGAALDRFIPGRTYRTLVPDVLFSEGETKIVWGNANVVIQPREAL